MNHITKETVEDLRKVINEALKDIEGVSIKVGKIRYTNESAQISLEAIVSGGRSKIERALDNAIEEYQLTGTKFFCDDREFNLIGYKKANWKYPFIATDRSLRQYKFGLNAVLRGQLRNAGKTPMELLVKEFPNDKT